MDFNFTSDQEQLRDAVRKWVEKNYTFEQYRKKVQEGGFSRATYTELADLGLCGLAIDEAHGGMGMGPVEAMVVMEELGQGLVLEPLTHTLMCSLLLSAYTPPNSTLAPTWLPRISTGQALVVLAHQEAGNRYKLDTCTTQAQAQAHSNGQHTLSGTKTVVPAADQADACIVSAMLQGQLALFLVEKQAAGMSTRPYQTQDGTRAAHLTLNNTPATLLCAQGTPALEHATDIGIAALCAQGVGLMEKYLRLTIEYLNTRKQFGVALSSFQALRHRVADMKMQLELARSMSYYATLKLTSPAAERHQAIARAKYQLGVSMRFVGQQCVQLHGGIGITDEYVGSHYFKKLTQMEMTFGDTLHHLGEVSRMMQDSAGVTA